MRTALSRREFLALSSASVLGLTMGGARAADNENPNGLPGIPVSQKYPEQSAQLRVKDPSRISILQITDTHFHCYRDPNDMKDYLNVVGVKDRDGRTVDDMKRMVDVYKPDLVAHTGDFWHDNPNGRGREFLAEGIGYLEALGVPWVYAWGNHDQVDDYSFAHDALHDAKGSLYRGGAASGNYTIDIVDAAGKPVWELICMNTHKDGLVAESIQWLSALAEKRTSETTPRPPAFAFYHIPIQQYQIARTAGLTSGIMMDRDSVGKEDGTAFSLLKQLKTVRAGFCGHNHKNDNSAVSDGIELVYGRSSGWSAYGWNEVRKGAKLITLNASAGTYSWETVFPDGERWKPEPGRQIKEIVPEKWMQDPLKLAMQEGKPKAA